MKNNGTAVLKLSMNVHFPEIELHGLSLSLRMFGKLSLHDYSFSGSPVDLADRFVLLIV